MASDGTKMEEDVKIKPDPANAHTPSAMDEDEYEDTGELHIKGAGSDDAAWLAKLPKWLWEAWSTIADDEEIELGKVRVYNDNLPNGTQKLKIVLNDIPGHADVPKKYDVHMSKNHYNNTVVFSEKDQPGFRGGGAVWNRDKRLMQQQRDRDTRYDTNKVSKRPYKSSIPKQTALAGYLQHEVTLTAVENDEYRRLTAKRFAALAQPKHTTTFSAGVDHRMHPGLAANQTFASFVAKPSLKGKKKPQTDKAVRVSQTELMDMLTECFKEYRYWSLKALKGRLKQPEAFIKSEVERIATLIRSGPFTGQWKLRPEYEATLTGGTKDVKEEAAEEFEDDDDDEDDEGDFEDVKMEGQE
ncbi:TFIIF beta subunit-like protein [Elsinoe fawcettii]|nr:TFIIF beta subunit-like protein [Elsinoe fawcettii]